MNLFKRHILGFLQGFIGSVLGGLIYSVHAGKAFNFVFNAMMAIAMGVVMSAMRLRARRLPKSVRRSIQP